MKNSFKILIFFIPLFTFSQENTKSILSELRGNAEIEICIKKFNKFIVGVDDFTKLKEGSSFELFDQNKVSINNLCIVKLNSIKDFDLFTVTSKDLLTEIEKNTAQANAFGYFLLYNRLLNKMLCVEPIYPGTIAYRSSKEITFFFNTNDLRDRVYLINNNLMPISSMVCFENDSGEKKYSLSLFEQKNKSFLEKIVTEKSNYSSCYVMPFNDLISLLESKPLKFNRERECLDENCYSEIARIVMKR